MRPSRLVVLGSFLAGCLALGPLAWLDWPRPAQADEVSKKLNNKIYIGEEADVNTALNAARRAEADGNFDAALDEYQRVIGMARTWLNSPPQGQEPRELVLKIMDYATTSDDERGRPTDYHGQSFMPVKEYCLQRINELPPKQKSEYLASAGPQAERGLAEAVAKRDRALVQRVADDFWITPSGVKALDLAAELAYEAGDFTVAAYYWERMRDMAEAAFYARPQRSVLLACAYAELGDTVGYRMTRDEAERRLAGFPAHLGGERFANLAELLSSPRVLDDAAKRAPWVDLRGLQRTLGNNNHARPAAAFSRLVKAYPAIDIKNFFTGSAGRANPRFDRGDGMQEARRNLNSMFPAAFDGKLVLQGPLDGAIAELNAADSDSANPLVSKRTPYDARKFINRTRPQNMPVFQTVVMSKAYAPVIYKDCIYGVMHPGDLEYIHQQSGNGDLLACYSLREDGALRWITPTNEANDPNAANRDLLARFNYSPEVAAGGDMIYVGGTVSSGKEVRYYAIALNATTGQLVWHRKIASRLNEDIHGQMMYAFAEAPIVTYDAGLLLVQTNSGALAGLDALTGSIRWMFKYRRPDNADYDPFRGQQMVSSHWFLNPITVHRGIAYFTPRDCERMIVLQSRTGDFFRVFPEGGVPTDLEYVLGVSNDVMHIQGRERVIGMDLTIDHQYRSDIYSSANELAYRTVPYSANSQELQNAVFVTGRGLLTQDAVWVPTKRGLVRFNAKSGKREDDGFINWPAELGGDVGGHMALVAVPDGVRAPNSPNVLPLPAVANGTTVTLPSEAAGQPGVTMPVNRRLVLVLTGPDKVYLIGVE